MASIFLALLGYLLAALVFVLDRYILKTSIPKPAVYAYFTGLFSLFALIFIPFGLRFSNWESVALSLLSGVVFVYGLVALYTAIQKSGIFRVAPLVGAMVPAIIFIFSSFHIIRGESFRSIEVVAIFLLVIGGLALSFEFPFRSRVFFQGFFYTIMASLLIAVFFMGFKEASQSQNFVSVFVWSRLGMVVGAFSLLFYGSFRREIVFAHSQLGRKSGEAGGRWGMGTIFITNKIIASVSYLCVSLAVTLGSVTIVQALGVSQYIFIFILGGVATLLFPNIFRERFFGRFGAQVAIAFICITAGTILTTLGGATESFMGR